MPDFAKIATAIRAWGSRLWRPVASGIATILDGLNWLLLAVATGCTALAEYAKSSAERLRR